ncbi:uncharacterized protein LOC132752407 [Ruditapes philippinarum]|uniref:uncharacterized protein LOC132752407 n=1 Tax=Ruditapes philippinarum TaxID=129788 RepID=UPI00295B798F|nr:uncharacterized protein LOC132752407 [Ruditapes philippinarum]
MRSFSIPEDVGGRKRKSTSKFQEWSKRSRKGVTYDDNENTDEKENKARNQCLSCIKCGKQLLPLGQYEKQKKHPEFLSCVFKKNTELIYFPNMKTKDCQLQTVDSETNNKGLLLNSVYDETLGCCIQYLQCRQCKNDTVIGARVLLADSSSQYTAGQLTGSWNKMSTRKLVMLEPRAADREDFDGMMKAFYEVVKGDLYNPYLDEGSYLNVTVLEQLIKQNYSLFLKLENSWLKFCMQCH